MGEPSCSGFLPRLTRAESILSASSQAQVAQGRFAPPSLCVLAVVGRAMVILR